MKLFGGSASLSLASKVAEEMRMQLFPADMHIFPDGERRIRITENVVGEECVVIQSANTPVDTNYMELFFLLDALKRSGAEKVSAVIPYFGYQRQDHVFRDGEAVSLEVIVRFLESLKIDRLISFDMHTPKIPDLFHVPVSQLSALPLFASEIKKKDWDGGDTILVSPDMGGVGRTEKLSRLLNDMPMAAIEKNRDLETGGLTMSSLRFGSVKGKKRAIMVDDMIASGKTLALAAGFLKKEGIEEVVVFATHAVFSEESPRLLQDSLLDAISVTDTVEIPKQKHFGKLTILSVAKILAKDIQNPIDSNNPLLSL